MSTKAKTKVTKPAAVKAAPRAAAVAIDYDKIAAAVVRALPAAAPQPAAVEFDYARVTEAVKRGVPSQYAAQAATYVAFGVAALTMIGWLVSAPKPAAYAAPLPVATAAPIAAAAPAIDYARIAAEVKAALPKPEVRTVVKTVTKTVVKHAAPRVYYAVPVYGCLC